MTIQWFTTTPALFLIAYLGMFSHFLKQKVKGETAVEIINFFKDNLKSTINSIIATFILTLTFCLTLQTGQAADIMTVFLTGFGCDSALNKWSNEESK